MSGDRPKKSFDEIQAELNRQALVEIGKRLAELDKKFWDLEQEAKDLKYASEKTLATAKRLQLIAATIVSRRGLKKDPAPQPDPPVRVTTRKKIKDPRQD